MKLPYRKLKRTFWVFCILSLLGGGYYLILYISCSIVVCSSEKNKTVKVTDTEEFINEEKNIICKHINTKRKINQFTINGSPQFGADSPYSVVYNYIKADRVYKVNESVTYSTHTTSEFLKHINELAVRWDGPISVAVYVPGYDFCSTIMQIQKIRSCGDPLIKNKVSWHLYWKKEYPPSFDWWKVEHEIYFNCSFDIVFPSKSWRNRKGLQYPINVGRNIARIAAKTWFILPSDIELYPSRNLANQFMSFIGNVNFTKKSNIRKVWPRVYVVPVFEVKRSIPDTKETLVGQFAQGEAVYFHRYVCIHCQKIPGLKSWLQRLGNKNQIHAFSSVKRHFPYHRWEPIFISTNNEPLYDERLSWEGLQDKMSQMHELCLRNYNLVILDRAFLVHSPGVKKKMKGQVSVSNDEREVFISENSKIYDTIMDELQMKFGSNAKCRKH